MTERRKPPAPAGLAVAERRLWSSTAADFDLRADELQVLEDACRTADLVDRLQAELDKDGSLISAGSREQVVAHPLLREVRAQRDLLCRLVRQLRLPDEPAQADRQAASRSTKARDAALARWKRTPSA